VDGLESEDDPTVIREWVQLAQWADPDVIATETHRWSHAYVGYTSYLCFPKKGIFRLTTDALEPYDAVGVPEEPLAIIENNGRLVIVNQFTISYSAPFDGENLTPELGGAGFQVIGELAPGETTAVLPFEGGFYVFTEVAAIIAEYVGGDIVYRFDRVNTHEVPLSNSAWIQMQDGSSVFLASQGLNRVLATGGFEPITPLFNEFLRSELATGTKTVKLFYVAESDMLFVQIMDGTFYYNHTYVLRVKLDKWGQFNEPHRGIVRVSAEPNHIGYMDVNGRVHQFDLDSTYREDTYGVAFPLSSEVELGYMRPANDARVADVQFEIQEIIVSIGPKVTSAVESVDLNDGFDWTNYNEGFYSVREDWNAYGILDYATDFMYPGEDEDWNLPGEAVDNNDIAVGADDIDWNNSGLNEDWAATPVGGVADPIVVDLMEATVDYDYNHPESALNTYNYSLSVLCNLDGMEEELAVTPSLAVAKRSSDLWTLFSHGHNHRLVVSANEASQKFHVKTLEITAHYAGQLS